MKRYSPAAARNIAPIADVLSHWLPEAGLVLELASGSGEHGLDFAARFPEIQWQPSDPDEGARASIAAWQREGALANYLPPLMVDATSAEWPVERADALVAINMVHISPWAASVGLFAGAGRILSAAAPIILYGPYWEADVAPALSNVAFDASLKSRNPQWGLRHVKAMVDAAKEQGFALKERRAMPANNIMLKFQR